MVDLNAIRGRIVAVARECAIPGGGLLSHHAHELANDAKNLADMVQVLHAEVERLRGERIARELDEANDRIRRLGAENALLRSELSAMRYGDE